MIQLEMGAIFDDVAVVVAAVAVVVVVRPLPILMNRSDFDYEKNGLGLIQ